MERAYDLDLIDVQDCIEIYEYLGGYVVINDGHVKEVVL
jgi:hypothetical protein